jgi:competence protein ComEA
LTVGNLRHYETAAQTPEPKAQTTETKAKTKTKAASEKAIHETESTSAAGLVNLNTADKPALESLPGVGPALADRIIAARPFKSVEDLKNVQGVGPGRFEILKDMGTVGQEEEAIHPKLRPGQTININTATQEQLEGLLGIGPVRAQAIIAGRPYAAIEDIMKVKGIKEKTFVKILE